MRPEDVFKNYSKGRGCWEWQRELNSAGYGRAYMGGGRVLAHRLSYEQAYGPIPEGLHICHRCDNPKCVRPSHLFAGTRSDNQRDKVRKGRQGAGRRAGEHLSPSQIREIRAMHASGYVTRTSLVGDYRISYKTLDKILRGELFPAIDGH